MGFKTITIKDEAYELFKRAKGDRSFSELIMEDYGKEDVNEKIERIMKYAGMLSEEEAEEAKKRMKEYRESFNRDAEERMKRLWGDDHS